MSATLEVRELYVLFGGAWQKPKLEFTARGLIFVPSTTQQLNVPAGYRVGLADVSFDVQAGECLAILGSSGAGKSSLLRTLAGLQPAAHGAIAVNGREISALSPERRGIVYLHQEPVLFPHLSALENVMFPLSIRGMSTRDATQRAAEMMFRLHVAETMGYYPDSLSGGQRHRVALARALCADPAVLLLDEPLASLDPEVRREVRDALLTARAASGAAVILVTHDLDDAMAVATHMSAIGYFADLTAPRTPAELLYAPPSLHVARLLGVYMELDGQVAQGAFRWIGGTIQAPGAHEGAAVACVRSHEVEVLAGVDDADRPLLEVTGRRDTAHEVLLDLRDASGAIATVRVSGAVAAHPGHRVQVTVRHARIFAAR
jgi:putative spermidine/putrescine transport system ATP-binding protein